MLSFCSFNKYSQITAGAVRKSLKESQRLAAEKRGITALRYQVWENGKGGEQVCTSNLSREHVFIHPHRLSSTPHKILTRRRTRPLYEQWRPRNNIEKRCHTYAIDDFLSQIPGGTQLSKFDLEHSLLVPQVTALGFTNIVHAFNMSDGSNAKLLVVMCNVDTQNMNAGPSAIWTDFLAKFQRWGWRCFGS